MKSNQKKFIGVFDSGFGGINILRGMVKEMPEYNYCYLGDTARAPYGTRSSETVYNFTKQAVDFLFKHNCEIIIIACNTASSEALRRIQQEYLPKHYPNRRVIGVLIPAAEEAVKKTENKKVGVIATSGTVKSRTFINEIKNLDAKVKVFQNACPLLVPIVEYGEQHSKAVDIILGNYLKPIKSKGIDTLILGCTHYGILESKIKKICGKKIRVLSESKVIPKKFKDYLSRHNEIKSKLGKNGIVKFYSTDLTERFEELGSKFFGKHIKVKKIELH